jgi:hypothetical protein
MNPAKKQLTLLTLGMTIPLFLLLGMGIWVNRIRGKPGDIWGEVQLHLTFVAIVLLAAGIFLANRLDVRHKFYYFQNRLIKSLSCLDCATLPAVLLFFLGMPLYFYYVYLGASLVSILVFVLPRVIRYEKSTGSV